MGGSTKRRPRSSCGPASSWHGDSIDKTDTATAPFLAAGSFAAALLISTLIDIMFQPLTATIDALAVPKAAPQIPFYSGPDVISNAITATQTVPIGAVHTGITIAEQLVYMVPSAKVLLVQFLQGEPSSLSKSFFLFKARINHPCINPASFTPQGFQY